jgi:GTP cyclohydrolase I
MHDIQNEHDDREITIDLVGVRELRYPIVVLDQHEGTQETVASLTMSVNLPHQFKGTHMSRFLEVLNRHRGEITMHTMPTILAELRERLEAERARIEVRFPYFLERSAPVSGATGLMDYECTFVGERNGHQDDFVLGVQVPVTSLCPCSKAISDYGAHNQRGHINIEVRGTPREDGNPELIWIEELIGVAEESASAPVYALLKRSDERHVTMQAYDKPVFVEDMVRNVAQRLKSDQRIAWFRVVVVNQESIHNHNAFARIEWTRPVVQQPGAPHGTNHGVTVEEQSHDDQPSEPLQQLQQSEGRENSRVKRYFHRAHSWAKLFLTRSSLDTRALVSGLDEMIRRLRKEDPDQESLDEWMRLAEKSLMEVKRLTEYEDEKASRILQAVAFMSALAGGVYVAAGGSKVVVESGLAHSVHLLFFLYAALIVAGAGVLIWGVRPFFNIPQGWTPDRLQSSEEGDYPPRSRLFFEKIASVRPEQWAQYFAETPLKELREAYLKDYLHEAYLVADKLRSKLRLLRFGVFLLAISSGVLLFWVLWCVLALFKGSA